MFYVLSFQITVEQLKEKVREQMGIEPSLQRLIFCGRVLQDEKRLAEYGKYIIIYFWKNKPATSSLTVATFVSHDLQ